MHGMSDWMGTSSGADLFSPLLPIVDEEVGVDPASDDPAADDSSGEETPLDPQDAVAAAAVRAVTQDATRGGDDASIAAKRRWRLEWIRSRVDGVSRWANDASAATSSDIAQRLEEGRATEEWQEGDDDEMAPVAMSKAAIVLLVLTAGIAICLATLSTIFLLVLAAGIATFLATQAGIAVANSPVVQVFVIVIFVWLYFDAVMIFVQSFIECRRGRDFCAAMLSTFMQCFAIVTFFWLFCAAMMILIQFLVEIRY